MVALSVVVLTHSRITHSNTLTPTKWNTRIELCLFPVASVLLTTIYNHGSLQTKHVLAAAHFYFE